MKRSTSDDIGVKTRKTNGYSRKRHGRNLHLAGVLLCRAAVAFLVALLSVTSSCFIKQPAAADNVWSPQGPKFSTILALARDPGQDHILLAGAYFGGLYRSNDFGFTWTHLSTDFSSRSIFAIAYASSSVIYIGTFRGGVYRSNDGGQQWSAVNAGLTDPDVQAIAVDPFDARNVLVATSNGGVFRSTDSGDHWEPVRNEGLPLRGRTFAFDPAQRGTIYLGTIGQGAYKSIDGGLTFTPLSEGMNGSSVFSLRFGAQPSRHLYAATDNGAYKLEPGSLTWTDITGNLPPYPLSDLLPHPVLENSVIAATLDGAYQLADDSSSKTWIALSRVPTRVLSMDPTGNVLHVASIHGGMDATVDSGQNWYSANTGIQNLFIGALAVIPGGADIGSVVYAGSDFAIHRGIFGYWDTFFDQKQGIFDIVPDPSQPGTLYVGTERSGVWKSIDGGSGWFPSSNNLVPSRIFSIAQSADGKTLFAGTSSGLYLSPSNGDYWLLGNAAQLGIVLSVAPDPVRHPFLFVGGADGQVLRSEDGGWSYQDASKGLPRENIVSLMTAPWEKTYAITATGELYATSDNGLNWFAAKAGVPEPAVSIAADPQRPWILYLGTSGGGIYKTESGSLTWSARSQGLKGKYVFSLTVDPKNPAIVYAGTEAGLFKSSSGGDEWNPTGSGLPVGSITSVIVNSNNPDIIYVSIEDNGIFRSPDGGVSWFPASDSLPRVGSVPIMLNNQDHSQLFAGTQLKGVFRSKDSGTTWQASSFGMSLFVRGLAIDPKRTSTLYAGSLGAGVFKSVDGGQSWENSGLRDRNIFKLAVDPIQSDNVYAATSRGVNRSDNGGLSWRELGQKATYVHSMIVNPRDRRELFVGTTAGAVYRSVDEGVTWVSVGRGLPARDILALAIDPSSGTLYAAAERQGVWRSDDKGQNWTLLQNGVFDSERISALNITEKGELIASYLGVGISIYKGKSWHFLGSGLSSPNVADVKITEQGTILAATYDAGVFRSVDDGASWQWAGLGLTSNRVSSLTVGIVEPTSIYAGTSDGVFSSQDDGQTWQPLNVGLEGINVWSVQVEPNAPDSLLATTNGHGVFVSHDRGAHWVVSNDGLSNLDVKALFPGVVDSSWYAQTLGGGISRSTDGGSSWFGGVTAPLVDSFVLAIAINPREPSTVYAGTSGRGILKTTNGGIDWEPSNNGLGSMFVLSMAIDPHNPETVYAGTTDHGVYVSTNGGKHWRELNQGLFNHVITSLATDPAVPGRVYAGTEGGGVFSSQVNLPADDCQFSLQAANTIAPATSAVVEISIATGTECKWRIETPYEWMSVDEPFLGKGPGRVRVKLANNDSQDARSGAILVAGQAMLITQAGKSIEHRLNIQLRGSGMGTVSTDSLGILCGHDCDQLYSAQTAIRLIASPSRGSRFVSWSGDPDCSDGNVSVVVDIVCEATFEATGDFDADGLPDLWEMQFGLDPAISVEADGPDGDPDDDGQTNADEFKQGSHPRGTFVRYFAKARSNADATTQVAVFNPDNLEANVLVRPISRALSPAAEYRHLASNSRSDVKFDSEGEGFGEDFALAIESDQPIIAEAVIKNAITGALTGDVAEQASTVWYWPDGSNGEAVTDTYYLLNPDAPTHLKITYLLPNSNPVIRERNLEGKGLTVIEPALDAALFNKSFAVLFESDAGIVVQATKSSAGRELASTHGARQPWFLQFIANLPAEQFATSELSLFNPTDVTVDVTLTYLMSGSGVVQNHQVISPFSNVRVRPEVVDSYLASSDHYGVIASASTPFVMSASSWWPGTQSADWYEGVMSNAAKSSSTRWVIASGQVGRDENAQTEIAIMNVSPTSGRVRIALSFEEQATVAKEFQLAAYDQRVIGIGEMFPESLWQRFSVTVEALNEGLGQPPEIVVDTTHYQSSGGRPHSGGTRIPATPWPR